MNRYATAFAGLIMTGFFLLNSTNKWLDVFYIVIMAIFFILISFTSADESRRG